jgi:hypothetical protein
LEEGAEAEEGVEAEQRRSFCWSCSSPCKRRVACQSSPSSPWTKRGSWVSYYQHRNSEGKAQPLVAATAESTFLLSVRRAGSKRMCVAVLNTGACSRWRRRRPTKPRATTTRKHREKKPASHCRTPTPLNRTLDEPGNIIVKAKEEPR